MKNVRLCVVAVVVLFWMSVAFAAFGPKTAVSEASESDAGHKQLLLEKENWEARAEYWQARCYNTEVRRLKLVPPPEDVTLPDDLGLCVYDTEQQKWVSVQSQ